MLCHTGKRASHGCAAGKAVRMGIRSSCAAAVGTLCLWGLKNVLRRGATTLPGRVAMAIDPDVAASLARRVERGSIVVCGTNGKTTTNNVLAEALEAAGMRVLCNRVGANMESGVATALLAGARADWGVFENDELSTVHILPKLKPRYLVLLNLFRDQLDRCGEIEHVQRTVAAALEASPDTILVYDADDPMCEHVAFMVRARGGKTLSFGVDGPMGLPAERPPVSFCAECGAPLEYAYRQYGQLGAYGCPDCGFSRAKLDFVARGVRVGEDGVSFTVEGGSLGEGVRLSSRRGGAYMVYNLMAAFVAAHLAGADAASFQKMLDAYSPNNGRLQRFEVEGRCVTLNLAKNPTGYNQNLALLMQDAGPKAVYVVVNDGYGDGRDVSWLWDVEFERLCSLGGARVYAGGHRANDLQVRLKYAGIEAEVVGGVEELLDAVRGLPEDWSVWVLPNYTALWPVKADLERLGVSL